MIKINNPKKRDLMFKIFSLICAIILWSYVRSETDPIQNKKFSGIEIRYENVQLARDKNLIVDLPKDINLSVTVSGKQSNIKHARKEAVIAKIDLSDVKKGENNIPINVTTIDSGVSVKKFDPALVSIYADEKVQQNMKTEIVITGKPRDNYILGTIKNEQNIMVIGGKSKINSIDKIQTFVDVTDYSNSSVETASPVALDSEGKVITGLSFEPEKIDVDIPILKTQTFPINLVFRGSFPAGMNENNFSIEPNTVTVKGNASVINKLSQISTKPIDIKQVLNGNVSVELQTPEGVDLVTDDTNFFIKIKNDLYKKYTIMKTTKDLNILNKAKEFEYTPQIEDVKITVETQSNKQIKPEDVELFVDAENQKISNMYYIKTKLPTDYNLVTIDPQTIYINVKH